MMALPLLDAMVPLRASAAATDKPRLSNVMLTMLHKMDVNAVNFVDSLGPVSEVV